MAQKIDWVVQRGYSIDQQLGLDGLSFEAFDVIKKSAGDRAAAQVRGKIISRLAKELQADCAENDLDIRRITNGCYCIAVGTGFEVNYTLRSSRIVYIGSGAVYSRIKSHLKGKLFDFASVLRSIPLRFYVCDLTDADEGRSLSRKLEQSLLAKFHSEVDTALPLLNARNAAAKYDPSEFAPGWDYPIQKQRGKSSTNWLLSAADAETWKGTL